MKSRNCFFVALILILNSFFIVQGFNIFSNEQDDKDDKNIAPLSSMSNSGMQHWNRTWGGINEDYGRGVAVDSSDNIYIAGEMGNFVPPGYRAMVLVKYNSSGVQQWSRTWGGINEDYGSGVAVDSSENVYVSGGTYSFGAGSGDIVLVKYNSSGVQQWSRTWGGIDEDIGRGVAVDSSDNVFLAGITKSFGVGSWDIVLVKYDSSGVQQWNRTWGGIDDDFGRGVAVDSSDNVYVSGGTKSFGAGSWDTVLVKYDSSGVQQWNRTWGGIEEDFSRGVVVDSSDNVFLVGDTISFGPEYLEIVLVKYDSSGVQQWYRTWGGINGDIGSGVAVDSSDNVYVSGSTLNFGVIGWDIVLVKFDVEKREEEQAIIGYDLLLFISVIGVITAIYLNKKYNKLYH